MKVCGTVIVDGHEEIDESWFEMISRIRIFFGEATMYYFPQYANNSGVWIHNKWILGR